MAVLAAILPVVSRSSSLALELYRFAASSPESSNDFIKVAGAINNFALILKQLGTIIKEDDRLPSHEAIEIVEDVTEQSQAILKEIELATSFRNEETSNKNDVHSTRNGRSRQNSTTAARLLYLMAHLEALRLTLSVLLQTLYTAQSVMWSKLRPTVSPQQAARAVANERIQLETLIIEQQMSFSSVSTLYEQVPRIDSRLLMETDSSQSLVAAGRDNMLPCPHDLYRYQDRSLISFNASDSIRGKWLPAACSIASPRSEHLLERWTSLPQFDNIIRDAERKERTNKRDSQQPTVESDSEEEERSKYGPNGTGLASPPPQRSGSVQPLFADTTTLPIPVPVSPSGPAPPLSPAASPQTSRNMFDYPSSLQSSTASLPVEAAAAVEAKEDDEDLNLEIPWSLCTRKHYWKFIDAKLDDWNTNLPPSTAFSERQSWTELAASWVCKEAIREAGYRFTQVQKERRDGRRTRFETCFCIEQPLKFAEVKHLVERTVEIYRQNNPPPPPRVRRTSFDRPPVTKPKGNVPDRDRTPMPPPLDRSTSSMLFPPPPPPPLDRSLSMPGSNAPPYKNTPIQIPHPHGAYLPPPPPPPPYPHSSPQHPSFHPQPQLQPQSPHTNLPPHLYPHNSMPLPSHMRYPHPSHADRYDDDSLTSDSGSGAGRERARRRREKSRGRHEKKRMGKSAAVGTLMGIGGLTALLDGLSGL